MFNNLAGTIYLENLVSEDKKIALAKQVPLKKSLF